MRGEREDRELGSVRGDREDRELGNVRGDREDRGEMDGGRDGTGGTGDGGSVRGDKDRGWRECERGQGGQGMEGVFQMNAPNCRHCYTVL